MAKSKVPGIGRGSRSAAGCYAKANRVLKMDETLIGVFLQSQVVAADRLGRAEQGKHRVKRVFWNLPVRSEARQREAGRLAGGMLWLCLYVYIINLRTKPYITLIPYSDIDSTRGYERVFGAGYVLGQGFDTLFLPVGPPFSWPKPLFRGQGWVVRA